MPTMLWNAYLKRRRITNVEKWLTLNKVYSYSELTQFLKEKDIIMSLGPAGTGKSFLAVSVGVTLLIEKT